MGPPASGKGTQAEMISTRFDLEAVSTGAMLRREQEAGTEIGQAASELTRKGELVPDAMITELVKIWLAEKEGGFVLDGYPRTVPQAEALEALLAENGTPLDTVIFFDVPFEVISDRILNRVGCTACGRIFKIGLQVQSEEAVCPACGGELIRRADDTVEALKRRMEEYQAKTAPLIAFYEQRGLLQRIAAGGQPEEVFGKVADHLER